MTTLVILAKSFADGQSLVRHAPFCDVFEDLELSGVHIVPPDFAETIPGAAEIAGRLIIRRTDRWAGDDAAVGVLRQLAARLRRAGIPVVDPTGVLGIESIDRPPGYGESCRITETAPMGMPRSSIRRVQR